MAEHFTFEVLEDSDIRDIVDEKLSELDLDDIDRKIEDEVDQALCAKEDHVQQMIDTSLANSGSDTNLDNNLAFSSKQLNLLRLLADWVLSFEKGA